jgi:tRNA-specific 2-thiouridylase
MGAKKRYVVAMSGGVDSSTVAAMLKAEGHDVVGITLQLYDHGAALQKKGACCAGQDVYDAQIVAETIGIKHYVLNYESIFKEAVMEDFADSYMRGETPIPCVRCNQRVKFADLFKASKDLGADALATGHYVQRIERDGRAYMLKGADQSKDQSYFLFATTQDQLDYLRFPLGHMDKKETRAIAKQFGIKIFDKPDSQDICFVPNGNYASIVQKLRPGALDPGDIIHKNGEVLGRHEGIINYTIGQRRGIGVAYPHPLYVLSIDAQNKQVIVGEYNDLASETVYLKELNLLCEPSVIKNCTVKLRSMHSGIKAEVEITESDKATVKLKEPYFGVTPGQACVMYDGDVVLGGGWICGKN